jgi:hypothetical protein
MDTNSSGIQQQLLAAAGELCRRAAAVDGCGGGGQLMPLRNTGYCWWFLFLILINYFQIMKKKIKIQKMNILLRFLTFYLLK